MKCLMCHEPIGGVGAEVELIEDGLSAWEFHPECYDVWQSKVLTNRKARQQARYRVEQSKLKRWNSLTGK